jgi:hypothetical protein
MTGMEAPIPVVAVTPMEVRMEQTPPGLPERAARFDHFPVARDRV